MARAVWSGALSFGLVNIPVRLFPATSPRDPRFHLVDRQTGRRIRYRRVVEELPEEGNEPTRAEVEEPTPAEEADEQGPPTDQEPRRQEAEPAFPLRRPGPVEREVPYSEVARGFDVGEGRHVVVGREELEALRPEPSRTIDIEHFVALGDVDPVHFEKSYQLAPADQIAEKPYALLRVAMERAGRVGIGRFVLRSREHLVLIRPTTWILGLETMYFADEIREPAGRWLAALRATEGELRPAEIEMAERLIEALTVEWDPDRYQDPYRERVLDLIRSRTPVTEPASAEEPAGASVTDLMEALKASVKAVRSASKPRSRRTGSAGGR